MKAIEVNNTSAITTNTDQIKKWKALEKQMKNIDNGHTIRQSMKYHYTNIREWCKPISKLSNNTSKITSTQQLDDYLNKEISKKEKNKENFKTVLVKKELFDWIEKTYHPTVFMTIQLPQHLKTENMKKAKEYIRLAMSYFERQLLGRNWKDYHLPFICFMEKGKNGFYHAHILFDQAKFRPWHVWLAANNTLSYFGWSDYCINLDIMNVDRKRVILYCLKEIKINVNGHFDSTHLILPDELFKWNLDKKKNCFDGK